MASTVVSQAASVLLAVGSAALLARWLGPEGKGTVTLALLLPETLTLALGGGVESANVYFSASSRFRVAELTSASVGTALVVALLALAAVVILWATSALPLLFPGPEPGTWSLALLVLPPAVLTSYLAAILRGLGRLTAVNAIRVLQGLAHLSLTGLLVVAWPWGVRGALLATLGGALASAVMTGLALRREGADFRPRLCRAVLGPALEYGLRGHVGNVSQFLNYRLDAFLVNYFTGAGGLGLYAAAVRVAELLLQIPNAIAFVVFPAASRDPREAALLTRRAFAVTTGLALAGAGMLAAAGPFLIALAYSGAFANAYPSLLALLPGMVFMGGAKVVAAELAGRGHPDLNAAISVVGLLVTLVLQLALIPRYGLVGAATATSLSYAYSLAATLAARALLTRRGPHARTHRS